jgi:hypothetical protein
MKPSWASSDKHRNNTESAQRQKTSVFVCPNAAENFDSGDCEERANEWERLNELRGLKEMDQLHPAALRRCTRNCRTGTKPKTISVAPAPSNH